MPSTIKKNYYIESEEDIPEEYRKKIEEMHGEAHQMAVGSSNMHSGKRGNILTEKSEITQVFGDEQEYYLGHGTGDEVVDLIFKTGLIAKDSEKVKAYMDTLRGVESTTIDLGEGKSSLFSEKRELLENWPHKSANNIIIIALPKEYILSRTTKVGTDLYEAFCIGDNEDGYDLRPEFIKGVYNSDTHSFIENDSFYKKLPQEHKQELLEEIKQKYIMLYAERSCISPMSDTTVTLTETDLEKATLEWYRVQLRNLKENRERMLGEESDFEGTLDDDWIEFCSDTTNTGFNEMSQNVKDIKQRGNGIEQGLENNRMEC